jgi:hypothetical protein
MALGKNIKRVRLNGGNNFQIKIGSTWTNLGHILKGQIEDQTDSQEVTFADGSTVDLDGKRKIKLTCTLAQTSKEEIELVDDLRSSTYEGYFYNGVVDGDHQEFYFRELDIVPKMNLEVPGSPVQIVLEMTAAPQSTLVSVIPDTGLPNDAFASGSTPVSGKNIYYVILETPVS